MTAFPQHVAVKPFRLQKAAGAPADGDAHVFRDCGVRRIKAGVAKGFESGGKTQEIRPGHPFEGIFGGNRTAGVKIPDLAAGVSAASGRVKKIDLRYAANPFLQGPGEFRNISGNGIDRAQTGNDNAFCFIQNKPSARSN